VSKDVQVTFKANADGEFNTDFDNIGKALLKALGEIYSEAGGDLAELKQLTDASVASASVMVPVIAGPLKGSRLQIRVVIDPQPEQDKVDPEKMKEFARLSKERGYV